MKKVLLVLAIVLVLGAAAAGWLFFGPATAFEEKKKSLYIGSGAATKGAVLDSLQKNSLIRNTGAFAWLASRMNYWETIKPGKYDIEKGSSMLSLVRMLRNGRQSPVNLVITKLRTKEDLARLVERRFETDSMRMIEQLTDSSLLEKYNLTQDEVMAFVLPDTYTYFWTATPETIYDKLVMEAKKFWTEERRQKAQALSLTPVQATVLASIVEEETNAQAEKGNIASVYLNRMQIGMPLQADPTVKFALKDFGLKRIYQKHLLVESPYNTYRNRGLPPGPISTPSKKTIDAVLDAPSTDYLYFVASPLFNGTHDFSATYAEHMQKARAYQQALNKLAATRKANQQTP